MKDYLAEYARALFALHGLDRFDALWALQLPSVDAPNTERGGWSSVSRLELADQTGQIHAFYLKRQVDHLRRSLLRPFGEATFAREFRRIHAYQRDGVPALEAVYFAQRRVAGTVCALLVTRALDDHRPLDECLREWPALSPRQRRTIIDATASLVRGLHEARWLHNCLYPKHVFIRSEATRGDCGSGRHGPERGRGEAPGASRPAGSAAREGAPAPALRQGALARLIDLEKTRRMVFAARDRARDLDSLNRHAGGLRATERLRFLLRYLGQTRLDGPAKRLARRLLQRRDRKTSQA